MRTVADILSRKGKTVLQVAPDTSVIEALKIMADRNIGSVVVMDGKNFLGIMTERDYSRKVVLRGRSSDLTTVADIMSSDFPIAKPEDSVPHCMQVLSSRNLRYLPVMQNGELAGIISMNDVVAETIISQTEMITYLQDYIQS
ncbi:CBS domain-containing protein [Segetibacter sp. 3557_3]|uniref:CBS domain-containing protein n=1 Tax=Segetibacter sp. 3557_3 TaxID=2547429 RepID=UPI001058D637|nr:CBS domain-containing protein [Segetibacter sp. 3557_3]TDH28878.1 CBS domain-containing protein [Segetibacter sp. 3557_3]